jgi:carboxymethylenebutenolidase
MCHAEVPEGTEPIEGVSTERVEVGTGDGRSMPALVARPAEGMTRGRVVIIHDVYGASPFYDNITMRVAAAGHEAILPDLFFRQGPIAEHSRDLARERRSRFDEVLALDDLESSLDHLGPTDDSDGMASIGFCMGGTFALDLSARRRGMSTVCFYGFPATNDSPRARPAPAPLDIVDQLEGPILGLWGDQDHAVGLDNVSRFADELTQRSVEHEFEIYPGIGHGFMSASKFDPEHEAYAAATDAWAKTIAFLKSRLG